MIWDAGAVPDTAFQPGGGPGTLRYATSPRPLRVQLAEIGYAPAAILTVSFSHFHWDHIGNANLFASATTLVRKLERASCSPIPPFRLDRAGQLQRAQDQQDVIITKDEHDVFGDGHGRYQVHNRALAGPSGIVFETCGNTGPILLSGDLYHYPEERKLKNRVPTTEFNAQQTVASRAAVEGIPEENARSAVGFNTTSTAQCQAQ